jgi:DNA-directed RNA polymerase specialized sigma24 family protein|tara:strand:+ start:3798 stop:4214 length:417 start_codon:yes stop_codon:yes gene_type:complete
VTDPTEGELLFERLKEINFPSLRPLRKTFNHASERIPYTVAEALISSEPFVEPDLSLEERDHVNSGLALAVLETFESLTEEEQWIYTMLVEVGLSMRFVARVLGLPKTTFARQRDELADKIRNKLLEYEVVRDRLGIF